MDGGMVEVGWQGRSKPGKLGTFTATVAGELASTPARTYKRGPELSVYKATNENSELESLLSNHFSMGGGTRIHLCAAGAKECAVAKGKHLHAGRIRFVKRADAKDGPAPGGGPPLGPRDAIVPQRGRMYNVNEGPLP
jgi:hypothetical protein